MNRSLYKYIIVSFLFFNLSACADIDQGLYSLSNTVAPADRVTGKRTLNLKSRQAQINERNQEGDKIISQILSSGLQINEKLDSKQYERIQNIFNRIHAVSHLKNEKWTAYLLPDKEWNAFTMGGSYIFINKGMADDLTSDDELAAVIGHEIAHVTANHLYEQYSHSILAGVSGSKAVSREGFQAAFTVKDEEEADQIGVLYATLAGYDPYAASRIWKKRYDNEGSNSSRMINHPVNSHRYQNTLQLAKSYEKYFIKGKVNPDSDKILNNINLSGSTTQLNAGQGGGFLSALDAVNETLSKHQEARLEEIHQQTTQSLIGYTQKAIQVTGYKIVDAYTLHVPFIYNGTFPIKNLNLSFSIGVEQAVDHADFVILPRSGAIAVFKFQNIDLNKIRINKDNIKVTHVEKYK